MSMDFYNRRRRGLRGLGGLAVGGFSVQKVDAAVDASDLTTYTFAGRQLGAGMIVIAGTIRSGVALTLSSITIASNAASVDVTSVNGNTSMAFIAHLDNNVAATGDVVLNLSAAGARAGITVYRIRGHTQAAAYLTGQATRGSTAGTMSPDLIGPIVKGCVIGAALNGLAPGHRQSSGTALTSPGTNYPVTVDVQAGVTTWTVGVTTDTDIQEEASGVAVSTAACAAAFK